MKRIRKFLANHLPERAKVVFYRTWLRSMHLRLYMLPVSYQSKVDNVYHCTVHKAGSQWFRALFFDPLIYKRSGLKPWLRRVQGVDARGYWSRTYDRFPKRTIVTPLYVPFNNFKKIPKAKNYRAIFVMRDPRDITVSYYFSMRYTHTLMGDVLQKRQNLLKMDLKDGLMWTIEYLHQYGLYDALRSWSGADDEDSNVLVIKLEDLARQSREGVMMSVMKHCDIRVTEEELRMLLEKYNFANLKAKDHRVTGELSHYRSGQPGDWRNYFDNEILSAFEKHTHDLIEVLGYERA